MQLQDIENEVLFNSQQSEMVNYGGAPNWSQATNPGLTKAAVDFHINRAYMRVLMDLADIKLTLYRWVFQSIAGVASYPLPPLAPPQNTLCGFSLMGSSVMGAGAPAAPGIWGQGQWGQMFWGTPSGPPRIQRVNKIIYTPQGQPWQMDFAPGIRLISWREFQDKTGFGYLRPFSNGTIPDYCSISEDRTTLAFYPGPADSGDTIGVEYVPTLTPNSDFPPLVQNDDEPKIDDLAQDLITYWATFLCCFKLRELGLGKTFKELYHGPQAASGLQLGGELIRVREELRDRHFGDKLRLRDAQAGVLASYPVIGAILP